MIRCLVLLLLLPASIYAISITLGPSSVVGIGASASCGAGYVCSSLYGTVVIQAGASGITEYGQIVSVNFGGYRDNKPTCIIDFRSNYDGSGTPTSTTGSVDTNFAFSTTSAGFSLFGTAKLETGVNYAVSYICLN